MVLGKWQLDKDFVTFKVDMKNALKIVSRQAVLNKCHLFPPSAAMGVLVLWDPSSAMAPTWPAQLRVLECSKVTP